MSGAVEVGYPNNCRLCAAAHSKYRKPHLSRSTPLPMHGHMTLWVLRHWEGRQQHPYLVRGSSGDRSPVAAMTQAGQS